MRRFGRKLHAHCGDMDTADGTLVATATMGRLGGTHEGNVCSSLGCVCVRVVAYGISANYPQAPSTRVCGSRDCSWLHHAGPSDVAGLEPVYTIELCRLSLGAVWRRSSLRVEPHERSNGTGISLCIRMATAVGSMATRLLAENLGRCVNVCGACSPSDGSFR